MASRVSSWSRMVILFLQVAALGCLWLSASLLRLCLWRELQHRMPGESFPAFCTLLLGGGVPAFAASAGSFAVVGLLYVVLGMRLIRADKPRESWMPLFAGWLLIAVLIVSWVFLALSAVSFVGVPLVDAVPRHASGEGHPQPWGQSL